MNKNILVSGKSGLSSKIKHRKVDSCCIQQTPGEGKRDGVPLCNSGTSIKQCLWNKVPRIKKNQLNSRYVTNRNNNNNKKKTERNHDNFWSLVQFLVYNHVTSRPCWWSIQYKFFSKNFFSFWKVRFFVIVYCFEMTCFCGSRMHYNAFERKLIQFNEVWISL